MGVSLLAVAKSIYYHTFDELVFQEHSDIEVTGFLAVFKYEYGLEATKTFDP